MAQARNSKDTQTPNNSLYSSLSEIFVGRQPIHNKNLAVYAYELLFRPGDINESNVTDGDQATSQVLLNTFYEIGLEKLVGNRPAFINMTRDFLLRGSELVLPAESVVLEILEDITVDEKLVDAVRALAKRGYVIALDDFVFSDQWIPLLEIASIVKIDILSMEVDEVKELVNTLKSYDVKLLAEKVETHEEFEFCRDLGFDYFQGYFFSKPKVIRGQKMSSNRAALLQMVARLNDPNVEIADVVSMVSMDIALSYKLLRYINSPFFNLPRTVNSIREAVVYAGVSQIRSWATLHLMAGADGKSPEPMSSALVRARLCELIATTAGIRQTESYFTVGLLSSIDAILDMTMQDILMELPLDVDVKAALLGGNNAFGNALSSAMACEFCKDDIPEFLNISAEQIKELYLQSLTWSSETMSLLD